MNEMVLGQCRGWIEKRWRLRIKNVCPYVKDVTFQQSNRPSGIMEEGKAYYSGRNNLNWYKVEVCILPNGLNIGCSKNYPGAIADIDIFAKMKE